MPYLYTRYNETSIKLQSSTCDLKLAVDLLESLHTFTDDIRDKFDEYEAKAIQVSDRSDYMSTVARTRKRIRHFDEVQGTAVVLQGRDKFRIETFLVIVNQLQAALRSRINAYADVRKVFQVVTDFKDLSNDEIRQLALTMSDTYSSDLQSDAFPDEMVQFVEFTKSRGCSTPADMAMLIHTHDLHSTFPNV